MEAEAYFRRQGGRRSPTLGICCRAIAPVRCPMADVSLVQRVKALFRNVLAGDGPRSRDLRVASGACAAAVRRLRRFGTRHRGPAVLAEGRGGGEGPRAHPGLHACDTRSIDGDCGDDSAVRAFAEVPGRERGPPAAVLTAGLVVRLPAPPVPVGGHVCVPPAGACNVSTPTGAHWDTVHQALIRLTDLLDAHPPPINHQCRRRLDYTELLPKETWLQVCERAGGNRGLERKHRLARCYLVERLSTLPAAHAPAAYAITDGPVWKPLGNALRRIRR